MQPRFARALARLHRVGSQRLADSFGSYQAAGQLPVNNIPLQVERDAQMNGADGLLLSVPFAVTWRKRDLESATRGAKLVISTPCGSQTLIVEEVIADDGQMVTAACMEAS